MAVQAGNNFLLSGVILPNLAIRLLENALTEKDSIKVELSYFFMALVKGLSSEDLQVFVERYRLAHVVRKYCGLEEEVKGSRYIVEIRENGQEVMKVIGRRLYK